MKEPAILLSQRQDTGTLTRSETQWLTVRGGIVGSCRIKQDHRKIDDGDRYEAVKAEHNMADRGNTGERAQGMSGEG